MRSFFIVFAVLLALAVCFPAIAGEPVLQRQQIATDCETTIVESYVVPAPTQRVERRVVEETYVEQQQAFVKKERRLGLLDRMRNNREQRLENRNTTVESYELESVPVRRRLLTKQSKSSGASF